MSVHGTFRSDAELVPSPEGGLRLRRRTGPRVLSLGLVVAALALAAVDAHLGRPWLAAVQAVLALAFVALHLRAELDRFWLDGETVVRRWVSLSGVSETRLRTKSITRIGVERAGKRARAWIETKSGDQLALVEGDAEGIERMAEQLAAAVRLAVAEKPTTLH